MEITGKVLQVLPLQSGTGANGVWKKQEVVFDQGGNYPKKVVIAFWKDLADTKFTIGQTLNLSVDCESREFNGKWYTDIKCWKILSSVDAQPAQQQSQPPQQQPKYESAGQARQAAIDNGNNLPPTDDLPF
jgi:hypothetical protein